MPVRAYYFIKQNGRSPVEAYLKTLNDLRQIASIQAVIERLIQAGGRLPRPIAAQVKGKIWELRTRFGNRVFYFIQEGSEIILLDGYTKKRDRIELRVLNRITNLYAEYMLTRNRKAY